MAALGGAACARHAPRPTPLRHSQLTHPATRAARCPHPFTANTHSRSSLGALATAFRVHPLQTTGALLTWVLFVMVFLACVSDWYDLKTPNGGGGSTTVIATLFFIEGCVTAPRTAVTPARSCTRTQLYDINTNLEWLHAAGALGAVGGGRRAVSCRGTSPPTQSHPLSCC